MQRSFTILYTSLLGVCLGSSSSFPSNINIGENYAHASHLYSISTLTHDSFLFSFFSLDLSIVSNINSRFFAAQQEDCSQPNRTNMRFFVSPSLITRTSPNWCRRWIWSKWGIASPWHMPVSIISLEADYNPCHFAYFYVLCAFFSHLVSLFIDFAKREELHGYKNLRRLSSYTL